MFDNGSIANVTYTVRGPDGDNTSYSVFGEDSLYFYDYNECTTRNGFAQLDTNQDASYYGTWANPSTFLIINFCEGDETRKQCENAEEFIAEIESINKWREDNNDKLRIDPGLGPDLKQKFIDLGLEKYLH